MFKQVDNYTYNTSNIIGNGTSSIVYLGNSLITNQTVAIRVINLKKLVPETLVNLQNQMSVLNYLPPHPNIVKLHCILKTENRVYMVTQYCQSKLDIDGFYDIDSVAKGIIDGVQHLIRNNIVHRDLKPENIMIKNGVPKLIDFGFARRLSNLNEMMFEYLGTPFYMSPQILDHKFYTSKSDVWSLGATLYHILFKTVPFEATTTDQLIRKIKTMAPNIPAGYNDVLATIIQGCLIIDQTQRYTWDEVFILAEQLKRRSMIKQNVNPFIYSPPSLLKKQSNQMKHAGIALMPLHNMTLGYGY